MVVQVLRGGLHTLGIEKDLRYILHGSTIGLMWNLYSGRADGKCIVRPRRRRWTYSTVALGRLLDHILSQHDIYIH